MLATLAQSGGPQWTNYIQIIVIVLAVSASAIGALLKKLAEQRAVRNQKLARERERETMLRTGRVDEQREQREAEFSAQTSAPPLPNIVPEDEARRRLQELAQRRRAELAEMARRAQSGGGAGAPPTAPTPPIVQPGMRRSAPPPVQTKSEHRSSPPLPTRPGMLTQQSEQDIRRARAQAGKDKAARDKAARKAAAQADRQRELERRQRAEREREEERRAADEVPHLARERSIEQTQISGSAPRGTAAARATALRIGTPTTPEEWRRAIILMELLNPPLALREDERAG